MHRTFALWLLPLLILVAGCPKGSADDQTVTVDVKISHNDIPVGVYKASVGEGGKLNIKEFATNWGAPTHTKMVDGRTVNKHDNKSTVSGVTVAGQPATIDQNGITIQGSGQGKPSPTKESVLM